MFCHKNYDMILITFKYIGSCLYYITYIIRAQISLTSDANFSFNIKYSWLYFLANKYLIIL